MQASMAHQLEVLASEIDAAAEILICARRRLETLAHLDEVHATALRRHLSRAGVLIDEGVGVLIAAAGWSHSAFQADRSVHDLPPAS